jgi:hypothetical protein
MAKLANDETLPPRQTCKAMSHKHLEGERDPLLTLRHRCGEAEEGSPAELRDPRTRTTQGEPFRLENKGATGSKQFSVRYLDRCTVCGPDGHLEPAI